MLSFVINTGAAGRHNCVGSGVSFSGNISSHRKFPVLSNRSKPLSVSAPLVCKATSGSAPKSETSSNRSLDGDMHDFSNTMDMIASKLGNLPVNQSRPSSERQSFTPDVRKEDQSQLLEEQLSLFEISKNEAPDSETPKPMPIFADTDTNKPIENADISTMMIAAYERTAEEKIHSDEVLLAQSDPRKIDADGMKHRLETLKNRRRMLAVERGEDAMKSFMSINPPSKDSVVNEGDETSNNSSISLGREEVKHIFTFTLARSRIISFQEEYESRNSCALTAGAYQHLLNIRRVPYIYKPFLALHDAISRADKPPCPRCGRRTPVKALQNVASMCDSCYTLIYLRSPPGESGAAQTQGEEFWSKEDLEVEESRALQEVTEIINSSRTQSDQNNTAQYMADVPQGSSTEKSNKSDKLSSVDCVNNSSGMKGSGMKGSGTPPVVKDCAFTGEWNVRASDRSLRTINPIRNLVQNIEVQPNPSKALIRLSVGDPTVYGNLEVSKKAVNRFCEIIQSGKANGYTLSMGSDEAREAVANRYGTGFAPFTKEDVILTSGASGAIEIAIGCIANEGDNILLPMPGFPLFRTVAEGYGIECRYYRVDPDNRWEICLEDLPKLADSRTRAIVVNNPSNPCGSVYSSSHIDDLLASASVLKLPIISDEVYADMVFSTTSYTSIASRSKDVPVLALGGISKQFIVPGWRLGWVLIHDRGGVFSRGEIRKGIRQLTTRLLVPNTPVQAMVPTLLKDGTNGESFRKTMQELEANAKYTTERMGKIKGIKMAEPQGAMYAMAKIDVARMGFKDDLAFVEDLLREESVFLLPGQCFQAEQFVRIVFSAPKKVLAEAYDRIEAFCNRKISA